MIKQLLRSRASLNMAVEQLHTLVVTTEHASTGKMGGIGSYNAETERLSSGTIFLLIDDTISIKPSDNIYVCYQYIAENMPKLEENYSNFETRDLVILEVVRDILNKNQSISNIATHEYSGIGSRIAEAARTGALGSNVKVRTHCHGGHIQLERATGNWIGDYLDVLNAERSSIENADEVWFAGKYLYDLYEASGMRLSKERVKFLGLPYELNESTSIEFNEIDTIAFVGRMNKLKGYDIFAEVVEYVLDKDRTYRSKINNIVAIGNDDNSMSHVRSRLEQCVEGAGSTYRQELMTRNDTLDYIRNNAGRTLFLLPYFSDNYSVAMLEIIDAGAPLLVLDTGGNRELINSHLWSDNRIAKNTSELIELTEAYLSMPITDRKNECELLRKAFVKDQVHRNNQYRKLFSPVVWERYVDAPSDRVEIEYIYIDNEDRSLVSDWLSFDSTDGDMGGRHGIQPSATHVFLSRPDIKYDIKMLDKTLKDAIRNSGGEEAYSVAYRGPKGLQVIRNGSLGQFVSNPQGLLLGNICLPVATYKQFYRLYSERTCSSRVGAEFVLSAILYALYAENKRVLPIPLGIGVVDKEIISKLDYDEAIFADFAHFQAHPEWESYRYTALLRHDYLMEINNRSNALYEYNSLLSSSDKAGRFARKIIGLQLRLISYVKKLRGSVFH